MASKISKATSYALIGPPRGALSKATAYAIITTEAYCSVSKATAYALIVSTPPMEVSPSHGPAGGGTLVSITGFN